MTDIKKPELLMPAGSLDILKTAVIYGADAVYLGGEFSLRAKAKNFTPEEMREGIEFAHSHNASVYVTVNIYANDEDMEELRDYLLRLGEIGPDAILIADPGVFSVAREACPQIPVHISTQANVTNSAAYRFWYDQGVKRIVGARELSMEQIANIRKNIPDDMEMECFVHGAMCISYSGRCILSAYMTGRSANKGECTHPCRWEYSLMEKTRDGEYMPIEEDDRGTYIMNSRDLCMIGFIPELMDAGVDSLKVEGRMKNALYIATVARAYRQAIDLCFSDRAAYQEKRDEFVRQVSECTHREFCTGFYFNRAGEESIIYAENTYVKEYTYLGTVNAVDDKGRGLILQKNKFSVGDTIEIIRPNGDNISVKVISITTDEGEERESASHASELLWVELSEKPQVYDIIRGKATLR
ncbi:MAG: U32 family peptidase [Lachnospiraceae bacterium]|nr:U32 family peptidase [Lachnospiraceae bacterium]